jgi:ferredoxin
MRLRLSLLFVLALLEATVSAAAEQDSSLPAGEPLPQDYSCTFCHADPQMFTGEQKQLLVTENDLAGDVHWQEGLRCEDCHGGNPKLDEYVDHRRDPDFRGVPTAEKVPEFCGRCHSDIVYMRRFNPSARTDQEAEYWTSGHGQKLKEGDTKVATCISCHGRHGILAGDDQESPVFPRNVAETCAHCHLDETLMAGRTYHDRPLGHDQYAQWRRSVHGIAMMDKGDLSAPTCNDCHGNHGAMPPGVGSVANACGTCHGKIAELFEDTAMMHRFEQEDVNLPGCATCHGAIDSQGNTLVHDIQPPTEQMLGMADDAVCVRCHELDAPGRFGAPVAGAKTAKAMGTGLENLEQQIAGAKEAIDKAERLGMEVSGPRYDLRQAFDALTNARTLIHTFSTARVDEALDKGLETTGQVQAMAQAALAEHTNRRIWLAASLVPILIVIVLLSLYIRSIPIER